MVHDKARIKLGVENLIENKVEILRGLRVGLICNQSSVTKKLFHSADLLRNSERINITTLFGPQHGIRGDVQDNMIETPHSTDRKTGLRVYSLYSETREPIEEMLENVDVLVFDMQDVGCRVYTFIYTLANAMRVAARSRKKVVVCDRPNPINGNAIEGNLLEAGFASFVGQFPIPMRHGMTVGELAKMFNEHFGIQCELEVVEMFGWKRDLYMDETDAPWVMPSPNMPTVETSKVFSGTVLLEGTMLSEGRGTTRPFEIVGAPFVNNQEFARHLSDMGLEGVFFRENGFQPTFQKHVGKTCEGVQIHITDQEKFEPVKTGVAVVKTAYDLYKGNGFEWKEPPYEYVFDKLPFDVIAGTDSIRKEIESGETLGNITKGWKRDRDEFERLRQPYLLY